jgi:flagellin-like protein
VNTLTKEQLRSKEAISPILATLLLVVIAVAAIAVTYAWVMTYMNSATNQAGISLNWEGVVDWQNTTPKKIVIYVRNTGISDATADAVYIGTSSTSLSLQTNVVYYPSKIVPKDGEEAISITVEYDWIPHTNYYFRIVPKVGQAAVFQVKA